MNPCSLGDGRVFVNSDATFFNMLVVGCGKKCVCKGQCRNSLSSTSLPSPFKFEIFRRSDDVGFGLRTLSNIPQGCAVVQFCGEVLDQKAMSRRGAESLDYAFCLQSFEESEIYEKLALARSVKCEAFSAWRNVAYIDPTRKGNIARFISHGCFPNLVMLRYAENDLRLNRARAILFASQPILGGSELFFDYGSQYLSRAGFKCQCGTMWCDSVRKRWRSTYPTHEEIMKKSLAYFAFLERSIIEYDAKAKWYLRKTGVVRPESGGASGAEARGGAKLLSDYFTPQVHFLRIILLIEIVPHPLPDRMEIAFRVLLAMENRTRKF
ncbi:hypothetical protein Y032_0611g645 [Ancylostoma ceylanicum]|uniref:SET domain-containing protein n=1 Tax=Ancylostoma ceylanicum TaxID=53326 RepID=A0A016WLL1_9BILA|nr:hypothetical protein Y032_0611g645 [Ancylostoma ceylanicum]